MSTSPKVSILLPNFNYYNFLNDRLNSILNQTLSDWELIIADSYSTDGSWELFQLYANNDKRFKLYQIEKNGVYNAINFCINKASGKYIYIATSDDTMKPECLEVMVSELNNHPDCDICHSSLIAIDKEGKEVDGFWDGHHATRFYGELEKIKHIRYAPYDALLHITLGGIYGSLTQLLIKREAIKKIGLFKDKWGPRGDYEWGIRAALLCNTVHIPEALATWRIHPGQLTKKTDGRILYEMIQSDLELFKTMYPEVCKNINFTKMTSYLRRIQLKQEISRKKGKISKIIVVFKFLTLNYYSVFDFIICFLERKDFLNKNDNIKYIKEEIIRLNLTDKIKVIE